MATASGVRSVRVKPARAWRCRSGSRSSTTYGHNTSRPKAPLAGPSPEAKRELVDIPIDYYSGNRLGGSANNANSGNGFWGSFGNTAANPPANRGNAFIEHFRRGADGQVADTQYQLMSREDAYAYQGQQPDDNNGGNWFFGNLFGGNRSNGQGLERALLLSEPGLREPEVTRINDSKHRNKRSRAAFSSRGIGATTSSRRSAVRITITAATIIDPFD